MITIKKTSSFDEIEELWSELYQRNSDATYYQSPEYMRASWDNLLPYCFILRIIPVFYVFFKEDNAIFILPLFKKILKKSYTLYGQKAGLGYLDGIYGDDITISDIEECFESLKKIFNGTIYFEHIKESSFLGKWLLEQGCRVSEEFYTEIPLPTSYEQYYASLSKHMKQNIRTAYNRIKSDGLDLNFQSLDYINDSEKIRLDLQKLYIERQIIKYGKNKLYSFFVRYVDMGTKIQKNQTIKEKSFLLYIGNEIAAYYDAIYTNGKVIVPRLAIAEKFNRYSPGIILINESVKHLLAAGIEVIDLTHGNESYKLSMGGITYKCVEGVIII